MKANQYEKTQQERIRGNIVRDKILLDNNRIGGTTTKYRNAYGTLYSTYYFVFKKNNRTYKSDKIVGTCTTTKSQQVSKDRGELIRGAYLNAVYQFRERYNVGSKGFKAYNTDNRFIYYNHGDDTGGSISFKDVSQDNPEIVYKEKNRKELVKEFEENNYETPKTKQTKKNRQELTNKFLSQAESVEQQQTVRRLKRQK